MGKKTDKHNTDFAAVGRRVVDMETDAMRAVGARIGDDFSRACGILLATSGRVIVTGIGKSGHIARKIAATLASTGSPALFVHPAEAGHGDMGMIVGGDTVVALSNSGTTEEISRLFPLWKRLSVKIVLITGDCASPLAQLADVSLDAGVAEEACPLGLAPTSSTTAALVLGDALAVALLEARGFTAEEFAFSHPGGALGRRLLLKVSDVMRTGDAIPRVAADTPLSKALLTVSRCALGMTTVCDEKGKLLGVFTDGDLRRAIDSRTDIHTTPVSRAMTAGGQTIRPNRLAAEALGLMEEKKITVLVVADDRGAVTGAVHLHDLLRAGLS